ncbi:hypothetical protein [Pseudoroseicyclus tamaricis]|uniref:Uncharacterized protein n=1 Tax=Pseudoroseicyclus tamaricis TaxID=2705421 RepID=A0A6B2K1B1_9RHOB|nr:hypothetical protein [Pseudoroseicyclus tamaricis]NDV00126.1 hypothetical protein [Pseudoroseicyclus tamaricis]
MSVTPESLEGRILAQRKLLARIVATLNDPDLDAFLDQRDHVELSSEDPGAVPDDAFSIEQSVADELKLIRRLADDVRAAREG